MNKLSPLMVAAALVCLSGCAAPIIGTRATLQVASQPSGALAEVSDGQKGITPCQFVLPRDQVVSVKVSKEGYFSEIRTVYPTTSCVREILIGFFDYGAVADYKLTPNPVQALLQPKESNTPRQ